MSNGVGYRGWVPEKPGQPIDRVDTAKISPEQFYERYVAARRPCVLTGGLTDPEWQAPSRWSPRYMLSQVPADVQVRAERRSNLKTSFGLGQTQDLGWGELLHKLHPCLAGKAGQQQPQQAAGAAQRKAKSKAESSTGGAEASESPALWYMTTQAIPVDASGLHPSLLYGPPLGHLRADFPERPRLLQGLIPWQYNLWMGGGEPNTDAPPSSSGLHHDFHDNLYVLLRGRKRFTLFPPAAAAHLPMYGRVRKIFHNGLIAYDPAELKAGLRSDGAVAEDVIRSRQEWVEYRIDEASARREALVAERLRQRKSRPQPANKGSQGKNRKAAATEEPSELDLRIKEVDLELGELNRELEELLEAALEADLDGKGGEGDEGDEGDFFGADEGDDPEMGLELRDTDSNGGSGEDEDEVDRQLEAALDAELRKQSRPKSGSRMGKKRGRRLDEDGDRASEVENEDDEGDEGEGEEADLDEDDGGDEEGQGMLSAVLGDKWDGLLEVLKSQQPPANRKRKRTQPPMDSCKRQKAALKQQPRAAAGDDSEAEDEEELKDSDNPFGCPDHFCRISWRQAVELRAAKSQDVSDHSLDHLQVELGAGDMLWLPAGWFHEVESSFAPPGAGDEASAQPRTGVSGCGCPVHMAFNFWFHPADRLPDEPGASDHLEPYRDRHWAVRWQLYHAADGPRKPLLQAGEGDADGDEDLSEEDDV